MATPEKKPPPFYCPQCGQKHRADLSGLVGQEGASAKITCAGCGIALSVTLDEEGLPQCSALETSAGEMDGTRADTPEPQEAEASKKEFKAPTPSRAKGKAPVKASKRRGGKAKDAPTPSRAKRGKAVKDAPAAEPSPKATVGKAPVSSKVAKAKAGTSKAESEPPDLSEAEFEEGDAVGRYTIEAFIAAGGTSTVYRAFDPTTNRTVALKVIKQGQSDTMRERFLREIEVQANIRHQNIMPVFDRGSLSDGRPFFTMELLYKPWSLSKLIEHRERGTLGRYTSLKELESLNTLVEKVLLPVCDGIYVANVENGVLHRDLKPDNVLVDSRTQRPYVIDFGICHVMERKTLDTGPVIAPTGEDAGIVGTPRFLSPEQARGSIHQRTDVWGLGALLGYCLSGEPMLAGATPITRTELKRRIENLKEARELAIQEGSEKRVELCDEKLSRLTDDGLRTIENIFKDAREGTYEELPSSTPPAVLAVVRKATSKSPSDRYVNARQMAADLQAWLGGSKVRALAETDTKAAAVASARRALRTHLGTAIWVLVGLGVGILLGKVLAGEREVGASTRIEDAMTEIGAVNDDLDELARYASGLTPVERVHLYEGIRQRLDAIGERLEREPDTAELQAANARLGFVRGRVAPMRVRMDVPPDTAIKAVNTVTDAEIAMTSGENDLPPGAYRIEVGAGGRVRLPLDVPLKVRGASEPANTEPALHVVALPVGLDSLGTQDALVVSRPTRARDVPYASPSAQREVAPFVMQRFEVTNKAYGAWLAALPLEARAKHTPSIGFVTNAETGAVSVMQSAADHPVVGITPADAEAYAAWLAKKEGVSWRLPTELEWVAAAGASEGHFMPGGHEGTLADAHLQPPLAKVDAHPQDVTDFGVRGMIGNVREIVVSSTDPESYVVKGAGVGDTPDEGATYRLRPIAKDGRHSATGFRLARDL